MDTQSGTQDRTRDHMNMKKILNAEHVPYSNTGGLNDLWRQQHLLEFQQRLLQERQQQEGTAQSMRDAFVGLQDQAHAGPEASTEQPAASPVAGPAPAQGTAGAEISQSLPQSPKVKQEVLSPSAASAQPAAMIIDDIPDSHPVDDSDTCVFIQCEQALDDGDMPQLSQAQVSVAVSPEEFCSKTLQDLREIQERSQRWSMVSDFDHVDEGSELRFTRVVWWRICVATFEFLAAQWLECQVDLLMEDTVVRVVSEEDEPYTAKGIHMGMRGLVYELATHLCHDTRRDLKEEAKKQGNFRKIPESAIFLAAGIDNSKAPYNGEPFGNFRVNPISDGHGDAGRVHASSRVFIDINDQFETVWREVISSPSRILSKAMFEDTKQHLQYTRECDDLNVWLHLKGKIIDSDLGARLFIDHEMFKVARQYLGCVQPADYYYLKQMGVYVPKGATVRLPVQRCPRFIENSSHTHMNFSRARFLVDYNARVDSKEMDTMTFEHPQPIAWEVQNEQWTSLLSTVPYEMMQRIGEWEIEETGNFSTTRGKEAYLDIKLALHLKCEPAAPPHAAPPQSDSTNSEPPTTLPGGSYRISTPSALAPKLYRVSQHMVFSRLLGEIPRLRGNSLDNGIDYLATESPNFIHTEVMLPCGTHQIVPWQEVTAAFLDFKGVDVYGAYDQPRPVLRTVYVAHINVMKQIKTPQEDDADITWESDHKLSDAEVLSHVQSVQLLEYDPRKPRNFVVWSNLVSPERHVLVALSAPEKRSEDFDGKNFSHVFQHNSVRVFKCDSLWVLGWKWQDLVDEQKADDTCYPLHFLPAKLAAEQSWEEHSVLAKQHGHTSSTKGEKKRQRDGTVSAPCKTQKTMPKLRSARNRVVSPPATDPSPAPSKAPKAPTVQASKKSTMQIAFNLSRIPGDGRCYLHTYVQGVRDAAQRWELSHTQLAGINALQGQNTKEQVAAARKFVVTQLCDWGTPWPSAMPDEMKLFSKEDVVLDILHDYIARRANYKAKEAKPFVITIASLLLHKHTGKHQPCECAPDTPWREVHVAWVKFVGSGMESWWRDALSTHVTQWVEERDSSRARDLFRNGFSNMAATRALFQALALHNPREKSHQFCNQYMELVVNNIHGPGRRPRWLGKNVLEVMWLDTNHSLWPLVNLCQVDAWVVDKHTESILEALRANPAPAKSLGVIDLSLTPHVVLRADSNTEHYDLWQLKDGARALVVLDSEQGWTMQMEPPEPRVKARATLVDLHAEAVGEVAAEASGDEGESETLQVQPETREAIDEVLEVLKRVKDKLDPEQYAFAWNSIYEAGAPTPPSTTPSTPASAASPPPERAESAEGASQAGEKHGVMVVTGDKKLSKSLVYPKNKASFDQTWARVVGGAFIYTSLQEAAEAWGLDETQAHTIGRRLCKHPNQITSFGNPADMRQKLIFTYVDFD